MPIDAMLWVVAAVVITWVFLCWVRVIPDPWAKWTVLPIVGVAVWFAKAMYGKKNQDQKETAKKIDELAKPRDEVALPVLVGPTEQEVKEADTVTIKVAEDAANLEVKEVSLVAEVAEIKAKARRKRKVTLVAPDEPDDGLVDFINADADKGK